MANQVPLRPSTRAPAPLSGPRDSVAAYPSEGGRLTAAGASVFLQRERAQGMASTGTIGRLVRDRGFGFIRDEQGEETFFHHSAVEGGSAAFDALREGQPVTFDRERDPRGRGYRAVRVQVAGP